MINSFARQLRELLAERSAPIAPGVFDGVSAKLTAAAVFRVAYMSGAAAAAVTGLPDIGLATQTELVNQVALLSCCLGIPLVADADTGFGDVTHAYRTVQLYERAGAISPSSKLAVGCARPPNTEWHTRSGRYPDEH